MKNISSLSLCFRFCILWMLDRRAKQSVHCCFMYWQQNCKINPECRFFIIDDSVIERAQLDFQILLHSSKWLYRFWSGGESAATSFCISCCIYVLLYVSHFFFFHNSFHFISGIRGGVGRKKWEQVPMTTSLYTVCQRQSVGIFTINTTGKVCQCCRLLQDQVQKILRQGRE